MSLRKRILALLAERPWLRGRSSDVGLIRPGALPTPDEVRQWADHGLGEWHGPTAVVDPCQGVW